VVGGDQVCASTCLILLSPDGLSPVAPQSLRGYRLRQRYYETYLIGQVRPYEQGEHIVEMLYQVG